MIFGGITSAVRGLGLGLMIGGALTMVASFVAYRKGVAHDRARSDLVIERMIGDANTRTLKAERQFRELEQSNQQRALRAAEQGMAERARNDQIAREFAALRRDRDGVVAERDSLRNQLANAARGPAQAADDSLPACRDRAAAYGGVLAEALRAGEECAAAAEANAEGVRTLRAAWPVNAGVNPGVKPGPNPSETGPD